MPALSGNAATYRAGGYQYTGYISTPPPSPALEGVISAVPATYPALTISYTSTYGSHTDVSPGMVVALYSTDGFYKGTLRIASSGTISSTSLPVNEFGANTYSATVGDTVKVFKYRYIFDKLVSATAALNKDSRIAYSDQGSNPPPVACSGGPYAAIANPATNNLSVDFYGSTSWSVDPDNTGNTLTHLWDFGGGVTSTSANPAGITLGVGFRIVKHTVTDSVNSKSTVQYVPVYIHPVSPDSNDAPTRVRMESVSYPSTGGGRATFSLLSGDFADLAVLPDGALIVYFEQEYYGGTKISYGSDVTGRSHIKFVGYLVRDSVSINRENNTVTFDAESPLGILALTPALTQLMISDSTPVKWSEIKSLTLRRAVWYMLYWGSTYTDTFDFIWKSAAPDLSYPRLAEQDTSNLAAQINGLTDGINSPLSCDRLGRLIVDRNPNFETTAERAARTKVYDFTTADVIEVGFTNEHRGNVKHLLGEGITTASAPVYSKASLAPAWFGTGSETLSKQIVASQTDMNTRTGKAFAQANGLYNGRFVPQDVTLRLPCGYDIFDTGLRDLCTFTLPATTNKRGVAFYSTELWIIKQVDIRYDVETRTKFITLTIAHVTDGPTGVTYIQPVDPSLPALPDLNLDFNWLDSVAVASDYEPDYTGNIAVFATNRNMYIADFGAASPTWTATALPSKTGWPGGSVLVGFVVDPYSPKYLGTGTTVNGWIVTDTHAARLLDIFGTPTMTGGFALNGTTIQRTIHTERAAQNFVMVLSYYRPGGVWAAVTIDAINWTEAAITSYYNATFGQVKPGGYVSGAKAGTAYASVYTSTSLTPTTALYKTPDYGATWAAVTYPTTISTGNFTTSSIGISYNDPNGDTIFYRNLPDPDRFFYRATVSGVQNISPYSGASPASPTADSRPFTIQDDNRNQGLLVGGLDIGGGQWGIWESRNLLAATPAWTTILEPGSSVNWRNAYSIGNSRYVIYGAGGAVGLVDNGVISDKTGNMPSVTLLGVCGN